MSNLFSLFKDLIPSDPLIVGTVVSSSGDTHQVTLLGGGALVVRGKATAGDQVFIKGGVIQSLAPSLTLEIIEI